MTPVVSIASGFGKGQRWQLTAYMTQRLGMCVGIDPTGNFCGAGVIGEPAELYPSDKAPNHELSGGTMMSGGFADALGLAAKDVRSVSLRLLSGAELPATMVAAPARLGADVSIYYRILTPAEAEQVDGLIARAADGSVIKQLTFKPIQAPQAQPLWGILVASGTRADGPWKLGAYVSKRSQLFLDLITADGSKDTYGENRKGVPIDVGANGREYDASFSFTFDSPGAAAGGVVYGAATKRVDSIAIVLQSGAEIPATIVPAPSKLGLDSSIFTVVFSPAQALELKSVVARAADGTVLQTDRLEPLPATTPPAPTGPPGS